jgi:hypothetical protein|tara:strand:- start:1064 stop:1243 length:180 start_codon:yes stop_codon:yes gene_type:complete
MDEYNFKSWLTEQLYEELTLITKELMMVDSYSERVLIKQHQRAVINELQERGEYDERLG